LLCVICVTDGPRDPRRGLEHRSAKDGGGAEPSMHDVTYDGLTELGLSRGGVGDEEADTWFAGARAGGG
jgi:hypothetical protein